MSRRLVATLAAVLAVGCQDDHPTSLESPASASPPGGPSPGSPSFEARADGFHFVANRDNGIVNWFFSDAAGGRYGAFVNVFSGDQPGDSALLDYGVTRFGPVCCTAIAAGSGLIAPADLLGSAEGGLRLSVNLEDYPAFDVRSGPRGIIDVQWTRTPTSVSRFSQVTRTFREPFSVLRTVGTSQSIKGDASGIVVGFQITSPPAVADLGTSQFLQVFVSHHPSGENP